MLQMVKKKLKNQKGFTLIELLAVIVILGIIAAIAIPAVTKIVQNSKADAVHAEAQQVLHAAKMYVADNNTTASITLTNDSSSAATNKDTLEKYLDNPGTYSVTVNFNNGTITYTNITVTKNGITKTYTDEAHLNSNSPS